MDKTWSSQIKKGLVELTVLALLAQREAYGYEILQQLSQVPILATTESTLYPLLSRLAEAELVAIRQVPSSAGPPRRYYRLTAKGVRHLEELRSYWRELTSAIQSFFPTVESPHG